MRKEISDEEILRHFAEREESAIALAHQKYGKMLKKIAYNLVGDAQDAEQCVWDTYWKVWNAVPPEQPGNLQAYLVTLLRRQAISAARRKNSEKRGSGHETVALHELEEILSSPDDPAKAYESQLLAEVIERFVEELPKREKALFVGRFYLGMPIRPLAAQLGIASRTVFNELSKIREKLRERLEREGMME